MREGYSVSVSDKVVEELGGILRKIKPIEIFMVVMPRNADYMEWSLILCSVCEFPLKERISFTGAGFKNNHVVVATVDHRESCTDYIVVEGFIRIFPFSHIGEIKNRIIPAAAISGRLIWHEPEFGFGEGMRDGICEIGFKEKNFFGAV